MASYYSPSIEKLIEAFQKLPSIGEKSAVRLAFYILNSSEEETNKFIQSIQDAKKNLKFCSKCFNISEKWIPQQNTRPVESINKPLLQIPP